MNGAMDYAAFLASKAPAAQATGIAPGPMPAHLFVLLWSNPGDVVLSPFAGIGSEGHVALKLCRKFIGVELKDSYFRQAHKHLDAAERNAASMFDVLDAAD